MFDEEQDDLDEDEEKLDQGLERVHVVLNLLPYLREILNHHTYRDFGAAVSVPHSQFRGAWVCSFVQAHELHEQILSWVALDFDFPSPEDTGKCFTNADVGGELRVGDVRDVRSCFVIDDFGKSRIVDILGNVGTLAVCICYRGISLADAITGWHMPTEVVVVSAIFSGLGVAVFDTHACDVPNCIVPVKDTVRYVDELASYFLGFLELVDSSFVDIAFCFGFCHQSLERAGVDLWCWLAFRGLIFHVVH